MYLKTLKVELSVNRNIKLYYYDKKTTQKNIEKKIHDS